MKLVSIITLIIVILGAISLHQAFADVWIPDNEFRGYFNFNGTYTVVGAVKNTEDKPVTPSITINVTNNNNEITESYTFATVDAQKDIPFKIMLPQVQGKNVVLEKPQVSFVASSHNATNIEVVYDRTLIKHADGHNTGFIINNDTSPAYGVRVYAAIYGKDGKFLDVGKSIETIAKMDPGEKIAFSMYPDSQLAPNVSYYSCFALGEDPTQTIKLQRNGNPYYITYISSGYVTDGKFDDFSQTFSFTIRYPFPDRGFVNFMVPEESGDEKYVVVADGRTIESLQSKDPDGYWHVAFNLPAQSTMHVTISGFGQHPILPVGNFRNYFLIIIPIAAAIISIIIWKRRSN